MKKRGDLKEKKISKGKKGQVWVETVVYLLIAFAMMGLVLSFIKPKIEEMRDKTIIEQSLGILKDIDATITTIGSPGNKRLIEIGVRKGSFIIDSQNNIITFEMESNYEYTEPGSYVQIGNIQASTIEKGRGNSIILRRDFSNGYDLTYDNQQVSKTLTRASNPYRLFITNNGELPNSIIINFDIE